MRSLLLVVSCALVAARSSATTLVGEARELEVRDLAAMPDGWVAVGNLRPQDSTTPRDGFVLVAGEGDETTWARRAPGLPLAAVSPLPDGGVLVGGREVIARLAADGTVAWQQAVVDPALDVAALACNGWDCWAGGSEALVRLDATDGTAREALRSRWRSRLDGPMQPQRLLALDDGSVVVAGLVIEEDFATAAACRVASSGVQWTQVVGESWPTDDRNAIGATSVDAVAMTAGGRIAVVAHDSWMKRTILLTDADRTFASVRSATASAVAALPSGALLLASPELRVERWDAGAPVAERLVLGVGGTPGSVRAATLAGGSVVLQSGRRLVRLAEDLSPADACTATAWACCPGPTEVQAVRDLEALFEPAMPTLRPMAPTFVRACASRCLAPCESACDDGRDDDEDGATDCLDTACATDLACGVADTDGDGTPNRDDCAPAEARSWTRAEAALFVRPACRGAGWFVPRLHWSSPGGSMDPQAWATSWADVVGGRLADLRAAGTTASGTCLAERARDTQWTAWDEARRHDAAWWVVRPGNACGPGWWGDPVLDAASPCR